MSENQTARILEAIGAVRSDLLGAIKSEFDGSRTELRAEIDGLRTEIRAEIDGLRTEIRAEIEGLRTEFRSEVAALRSRMDVLEARVASVRADVMARIDRLQDAMTVQKQADEMNLNFAERAARDAALAREDVQKMSTEIVSLVRMISMLQSRMDQYEGRDGAGSAH